MKKTYLSSLIISVFILSACTLLYSADEYVITTSNEQIRFRLQGEKRYVAKQSSPPVADTGLPRYADMNPVHLAYQPARVCTDHTSETK